MNRETLTTEPASLPMSIWPAETFPLEPVQGWIHRAAERNYAFSTDTFVASLGLSGKDWDYDELLKIVSQLPIESYADIEHCTPKRGSQGYDICGHKVPSRFISKNERRVCPRCLEEERYVRTWFDFVPVAACPHHDVALVGGLPNDPLNWRHTQVGWTQSGVKVGAEHATLQIASKMDRYLVGALSGSPSIKPEHLSGVSLGEILTASICVGKLARGDEKHPSTTENVRQLCQLGFTPLIEGSDSVIDFLRQANWLRLDNHKKGYQSRLNGVSTMLGAVENGKLRHLIADGFTRARLRNGVATPSGRLSRYDGEDDLINLKGAARRLGLSTRTLQKLLCLLGIKSKRCKRTHVHRLTHEQIDAIQGYIEKALNADEAAHLLGCSPQDLDSLVKRKLLTSDFRMRGRSYYSKFAIDEFVNKLLSATEKYAAREAQLIGVYAKQMAIPLAEVCSRIIRNKGVVLVGHDHDVPIFQRLTVADGAILSGQTYSDRKPRTGVRHCAQIRDAITFAEAAARLGTSHNGLKGLIRASLIAVAEGAGHSKVICEQSLARFEKQYIKASAYASIFNCHPTSALKLLRAAGVRPINDWKSAGPRFVDQQEVMRLTGLERPETPDLAGWQSLQTSLAEHLAIHAVPATTRVTGTPAIDVRATSGRWSFLIEQEQESGNYSLTSNFTSQRQPGRLKRVRDASVDPSDIWPGATVLSSGFGGFIIVDELLETGSDGSDEASLIDKVASRAHEIHRLL